MSQHDDRSSTGPLLILFLGLAFSVAMTIYVFAQFRFVLGGTSVEATVTRLESGTAEMTFKDEMGETHTHRTKLSESVAVGETVALRYLTGDPKQVRIAEDIGSAWRWGLLWVLMGLVVTGVGILLVWGRHPGRWRPGRPGER